MTKQRKTVDSTDEDAPIQVSANKWQCYAHGCPVFAVIAHGDAMICRFHSDVVPERWAGITTRLREVEKAVDLATKVASHAWVSRTANWDDYADRVCDDMDEPELKPRVVEVLGWVDNKDHTKGHQTRDERDHPVLYAYRLNAWIRMQVFAEGPEPGRRDRQLSQQEHAIALRDALPQFNHGGEAA